MSPYMSPCKHVSFLFTLESFKVAFALQNEVPIFALTFISLYQFFADTAIGNRYSNIILLLVSFISILSNFRLNNQT